MIDERILKHKVIILEGLPGCGKTTLANRLVKEQGRVYLTTFPNRKEGAVEIIRAEWHWPTAHIEQLLTIQQMNKAFPNATYVLDRGLPTAMLYQTVNYGAVKLYKKLMMELDAVILHIQGTFAEEQDITDARCLYGIVENVFVMNPGKLLAYRVSVNDIREEEN